jgi:anthranilate phosphoribosyltransferase
MKSIAPVRQAMGTRTIFNLVGPLANPARTPYLVIGAFSLDCARMMADTLAGMDIERAFVIHGEPGWDEPTPVGPYVMFDVRPGSVTAGEEDPLAFGLARCSSEDLLGGDAQDNATAIGSVFAGEPGPHRDALLLGSSLALRVTGSTTDSAFERSRSALDDGSAAALVDRLANQTVAS